MNVDEMPTEEFNGYRFAVERMTHCVAKNETQPLHAAHWEETEGYRHVQGMQVNYASYASMEKYDQLIYFTIRRDGVLIGHLAYIIHVARHTSKRSAIEDFLYLIKEERGYKVGPAFLQYAVRVLKACGCKEIGMSSKLTHNIDSMLTKVGFKHVANFYTMNVD